MRGRQLFVTRTRDEFRRARAALTGTVAFVPTMGALHVGHRALLRHAAAAADRVVVSIFVNPMQFGAGEDLDRYPRAFDADLDLCGREGVSLVYAPAPEDVYRRPPTVAVHAGALGDRFEGASRPGHFDGVLTVVAKFFHLVRPDVAVFGRKDAQQLALVRAMVADLGFDVRTEAVPPVRDDDGLVMSSRNAYLSGEQRQAALVLPSSLDAAALAAADGTPLPELPEMVRALVDTADGVRLDYAALVDPDTFDDVATATDLKPGAEPLLVAAVCVGNIRLIDNVVVTAPRVSSTDDPEEPSMREGRD